MRTNRPSTLLAAGVLAGGVLLGCDPPGAGEPDVPPELEEEAPDEDDPVIEEDPDEVEDVTDDTGDSDADG